MKSLLFLFAFAILLVACKQQTKAVSEDTTAEYQEQQLKSSESETRKNMKKSQPKIEQSDAGSSEALTKISNKDKKLEKYKCEKEWINEQGVCEVPNRDYHPKKKD